MRVRDASYRDYGLSESDCNALFKKCQAADRDTEKILFAAAQESNEEMAADLFYSLRRDVSFECLDTAAVLPYNKVDFYGYRRKALYLFSEKLQEQNKEVVDMLRDAGYIRRYCSIEDAMEEMQLSEDKLRKIAKKARAIVRIGTFIRVNMVALYQYIDQEYALQ